MRQPPGVLMVTGAYYPEVSGAGLQCRTLVGSLRDLVTFTVLTTCTERSLPQADDIDGVPVYRIPVEVGSVVSQLRAAGQIAWAFVRFRRRFEVVHLHGFSRKTLLVILLARWLRKRIIQKLTSAGQDDPLSVSKRGWMSYRLYRSADRFLAPSPKLADLYRASRLPLDRLVEVPNGVDTERFRPPAWGEREAVRWALGVAQDTFLILFVGFFSHEKRPDLVFAAWKRVRQVVPLRSEVVFVGATHSGYCEVDPSLSDNMLREARDLGIEKHLHFVERTLEIEQYYKAADCLVLPSTREGFPNSLLEAMASGVPCVATRIEGVTDHLIVHGESGFLFSPGDLEELSRLLAQLMQDPDLRRRMGERARETVRERFAIADVARRVLQIYEGLGSCRSTRE